MISRLLGRLPVLARGVTLLLNALMAVAVSRLFGASAAGEFFLAFTAVNVAGMIGRLGTENQAIKSLPLKFHDGNFGEFWGEIKWLRRMCREGSLIAGLVLLIGGALVWWLSIGQALGIHLVILALSIPFSSASILESSALRAARRISLGAFAETGLSQGLTIVSLLAVTARFHVGPPAASICYSASAVCTALLARIWTHRAIPYCNSLPEMPSVRPPHGIRLDMLHMMGSSVLFFVLTSSPLIVLGISAGASEVGFYNAAARSSTLISLIPAIQTTYLVPRVARLLASRDVIGANILLKRAVRQAAFVTVLVAAAMLTFAQPIMQVFGGDFVAAHTTLIALVVGQAVLVFLGNVNPIMILAGLERPSVVFVLFAIAVGAFPMLYAASAWGSMGVALVYVSMSVGYSVACDILLVIRLGIRCSVS